MSKVKRRIEAKITSSILKIIKNKNKIVTPKDVAPKNSVLTVVLGALIVLIKIALRKKINSAK
jgi:hypothetical protein